MGQRRDLSDPDSTGIDLRRLRYFVAVCDHGGFSRAADIIGIAQPALTRHIKLLESELGMPLFKRTGRGAEPTEQARYILARTRNHLEGLDTLVRKVRKIYNEDETELTLGVCPTVAPLFLSDFQKYIREEHPNVTVSVVQAYSGDIDHLLQRGRLDLALTYASPASEQVTSINLVSEDLVLVSKAPTDTGPIDLAELAGHNLILPSPAHRLRQIVDSVGALRGIDLSPSMELDALDAVVAMLESSSEHYATILPRNGLSSDMSKREMGYRPINDPEMKRTIAAVVPRTITRVMPGYVLTRIREQATALKHRLPTLY